MTKPVGWRNDRMEHGLAAKGVKTRFPVTFPSRESRELLERNELVLVPYKGKFYPPEGVFEPRICKFCGTVGAVVGLDHPACEMCGKFQEDKLTEYQKNKMRKYISKFITKNPELKPREWNEAGEVIR